MTKRYGRAHLAPGPAPTWPVIPKVTVLIQPTNWPPQLSETVSGASLISSPVQLQYSAQYTTTGQGQGDRSGRATAFLHVLQTASLKSPGSAKECESSILCTRV